MNNYLVYSIADPFSKEVRYIGMTSDFERRKAQHLNYKCGSSLSRFDWVENLLKLNEHPIFSILEFNLSKMDAIKAEKRLILEYSNNTILLNGFSKGKIKEIKSVNINLRIGNEIRIVNPDKSLFDTVVKLAKHQKRSISKQGEILISAGIKSLSNIELTQ